MSSYGRMNNVEQNNGGLDSLIAHDRFIATIDNSPDSQTYQHQHYWKGQID